MSVAEWDRLTPEQRATADRIASAMITEVLSDERRGWSLVERRAYALADLYARKRRERVPYGPYSARDYVCRVTRHIFHERRPFPVTEEHDAPDGAEVEVDGRLYRRSGDMWYAV